MKEEAFIPPPRYLPLSHAATTQFQLLCTNRTAASVRGTNRNVRGSMGSQTAAKLQEPTNTDVQSIKTWSWQTWTHPSPSVWRTFAHGAAALGADIVLGSVWTHLQSYSSTRKNPRCSEEDFHVKRSAQMLLCAPSPAALTQALMQELKSDLRVWFV